jgi:hypothetical protein
MGDSLHYFGNDREYRYRSVIARVRFLSLFVDRAYPGHLPVIWEVSAAYREIKKIGKACRNWLHRKF